MFPVLVLFTSVDNLEPDARVTGSEKTSAQFQAEQNAVRNRFETEIAQFGPTEWCGTWIMSAGPFGAASYMQWRVRPAKALDLARLMEYAEQPHGNMVGVVMRDNTDIIGGSLMQRLPTYLSLQPDGDDLDSLSPTQSSGWSAKLSEAEAEIVNAAVSDWNTIWERMEKLEADNRVLRAKLNSI